MSENAIDSNNISKLPDTAKPKGARKAGKKAKGAKKASAAKASKPKTDCTNKKAEVIALMKRAKGATLPEIMKATGWQPHTVRGFVSILSSKGGRRSTRPGMRRANGRTRSGNSVRQLVVQTPPPVQTGAAFPLSGVSK
jgi:hypothetical protein